MDDGAMRETEKNWTVFASNGAVTIIVNGFILSHSYISEGRNTECIERDVHVEMPRI